MSYNPGLNGLPQRPEDNAMSGINEYGAAQRPGDKPLKIKLKLTPELARSANPNLGSPMPTTDYDSSRASTRSRNQYTKGSTMDTDVEMTDATAFNAPASKKNTGRNAASKDIRTSTGVPQPITPSQAGRMRASGRQVVTPAGASGYLPGSPMQYNPPQTPPHLHQPFMSQTPSTPSTPFQHQKNIRMETPGTPSGGGLLEDSLPGGEDGGSALGSDEEGEDGANKSKSKNNKRGKPKTRGGTGGVSGRNNKIKEDDDSMFVDDDAHNAGYNAANAIWKTVEAYFADFSEEDIRFCTPEAKDDAFRIPPLGKKNPNLMLNQSMSDMMDITPSTTGGAGFGANGPSFVARLVSTLVEESSFSSLPQFLNTRPPLTDVPMAPHEMDPLFGVVSQQEMDFIEQKLKKDLTALGLFGDLEPILAPQTPVKESSKAQEVADSDDDEVVTELKKLQAKLKAQLDVNNQTKALLRQQIEATNGARKKAKEEREALNKLESQYVQQLKAIIKKKKKPAGKTPSKSVGKE